MDTEEPESTKDFPNDLLFIQWQISFDADLGPWNSALLVFWYRSQHETVFNLAESRTDLGVYRPTMSSYNRNLQVVLYAVLIMIKSEMKRYLPSIVQTDKWKRVDK
ncbi:hypothetical protein RF11_05723 [Thelohanellus kitauei]|uniref:Uncharacterized protein n=1 Tax=Thelohanellus kitauei TaxID=669202 RepID=A0A0C2MVB9_THEKT|nr:hypothetical protein RF11_05723 [Thelohanellus kitauei]